jgi:hypothetical protein
MKKYSIILYFTIIGLLFLNSCCFKKYCYGLNDIHQIYLYNFSITDIDTIYLLKYNIGNNFTSKIDSSFYDYTDIENKNNQQYELILNDYIQKDFEYKLVFKDINQEYKIKNITSKKKKCSCDDYDALTSYVVNDSTIEKSQFLIYR